MRPKLFRIVGVQIESGVPRIVTIESKDEAGAIAEASFLGLRVESIEDEENARARIWRSLYGRRTAIGFAIIPVSVASAFTMLANEFQRPRHVQTSAVLFWFVIIASVASLGFGIYLASPSRPRRKPLSRPLGLYRRFRIHGHDTQTGLRTAYSIAAADEFDARQRAAQRSTRVVSAIALDDESEAWAAMEPHERTHVIRHRHGLHDAMIVQGVNDDSALAVSRASGVLCFYSKYTAQLIQLDELVSIDPIVQHEQTSTANTGRVIAGAAIGDLVAGPLGAIVGAMSASQSSAGARIFSVGVKLLTKHPRFPVFVVVLFKTSERRGVSHRDARAVAAVQSLQECLDAFKILRAIH